ncbi:MAG: hypothetical protein WDW36_007028 [Sanguina aurantia]
MSLPAAAAPAASATASPSPTSSVVFPLGPAASGSASQPWPAEWLAGTPAEGRDSIQLNSIFANCSINLDSSDEGEGDQQQQPIQHNSSQTVISAAQTSVAATAAAAADAPAVASAAARDGEPAAVLITLPAKSHPGQHPSSESQPLLDSIETPAAQSDSGSQAEVEGGEEDRRRGGRGRGSDTLRNIPLYQRRSVLRSASTVGPVATPAGQKGSVLRASPKNLPSKGCDAPPAAHLSSADRGKGSTAAAAVAGSTGGAPLRPAPGRASPTGPSFGSKFTGVSTPAAVAAQTALATSRGSQRLPTAFDAMHNPPASRLSEDEEEECPGGLAMPASPHYTWSRVQQAGGNHPLEASIGDPVGGVHADDHGTLFDSNSLTISEPTQSSASGGSSRTVPSQASLHTMSTVSAAPSIDAQHGITLTPQHSTQIPAAGAGLDLDFSLSGSGDNSSQGMGSPPGPNRFRRHGQPLLLLGGAGLGACPGRGG